MAQARTVGYYVAPEKLEYLLWPQLMEEGSKRHNLHWKEIDATRNLGEQGPFNLVICKCNRELSKESKGDQNSLDILQRFEEYGQQTEGTVAWMDSVSSQRRLMSRTEMSAIFDAIPAIEHRVRPLKSLVVTSELPPNFSFPFPAMAKSLVAAGSAESHEMGVVFNSEGVNRFRRPLLLQEYVNHDAIIEKIYVVGNKCWCVRKRSLPNFEASDREPLMFNSQKFEDLLGVMGNLPQPSQEILNSVSKAISTVANLSIFGFDIIRDVKEEGEKYAVIDLNFFPSFRGVDGLHEALLALIMDKLGASD